MNLTLEEKRKIIRRVALCYIIGTPILLIGIFLLFVGPYAPLGVLLIFMSGVPLGKYIWSLSWMWGANVDEDDDDWS